MPSWKDLRGAAPLPASPAAGVAHGDSFPGTLHDLPHPQPTLWPLALDRMPDPQIPSSPSLYLKSPSPPEYGEGLKTEPPFSPAPHLSPVTKTWLFLDACPVLLP